MNNLMTVRWHDKKDKYIHKGLSCVSFRTCAQADTMNEIFSICVYFQFSHRLAIIWQSSRSSKKGHRQVNRLIEGRSQQLKESHEGESGVLLPNLLWTLILEVVPQIPKCRGFISYSMPNLFNFLAIYFNSFIRLYFLFSTK